MKVTVFASKIIGHEVLKFLSENHSTDIVSVVTDVDSKSVLEGLFFENSTKFHAWSSIAQNPELLVPEKSEVFILAWWPHLLSEELFSIPSLGTINTHNSLLPIGRGVAPNYWALRNDEPYGVTIHKVEAGIDSGPILAQQAVAKDWTDTGETLYRKGLAELTLLFRRIYPELRSFMRTARVQDLQKGSLYSWRQTLSSDYLELDEELSVREVLNRIRAKQFSGKSGAYFTENGKSYEVRVEIVEKADHG